MLALVFRVDGRWVLVLLVGAACSATKSSELDEEDDNGTTSGSGANTGVGGLFETGGGGPGGGGPSDGCTEEAKLIYVLTDANEMYSFRPDQKLFQKIGVLGCQTDMSPNSMAVDRKATAWVNYVGGDIGDSAGAIYQVSTKDASCQPAPTVTLQSGWFRIGMGFSTDGADTKAETLFVTGIGSGGGLGRVDPQTNTVVPVGTFTGPFANQDAELTGTGDGRLYGFFTSSPVQVAQLDKTNASAIDSKSLPTVEVPNAWAFSFWGGDFYLYTATFGSSRVNRYRPSDGTVDTEYMTNVGFRIVGAGVSTCAPLQPPN